MNCDRRGSRKRVMDRLAKHATLMQFYMHEGMLKEDASKRALIELNNDAEWARITKDAKQH